MTGELAVWLAAAPTAVVTLLAIVVLGPPLSRVAFPPLHFHYWPELRNRVNPEELEHAHYVLALTAPVILVALTWLLVKRSPPRVAARAATVATTVQCAVVLVVVVCFVAQWTYVFHTPVIPSIVIHYFSWRTLVAAGAIAGGIVAAAGSRSLRARWSAWTRESPGRAAVAWLVALVMVGLTVLPAIQTDAGVADANHWVLYHLQFTFDETAAVIDGRSPIGDFATQYAALWAYVLAPGVALFGNSLASFTIQLAALTGLTMLALFDVLRRVVGSTTTALVLFLPVLATSAFRLDSSSPVDRYSLVNYFGTLPLRYAAPFALAWLVARHLDGARPRRAWPLFLVAGLAVVNNTDFGIPALGATIAALLVTRSEGAPALRVLAGEAIAGLAAALGLVTAFLLLRTGSLPDFGLLLRYAKVYVGGFSLAPIRPTVGVSSLIFLTYVAAIGAAAARTIDRVPGRLLTGLLMWIGIFGLGAGGYYVGHSIPEKLIHHFPNWAIALVLLSVLAVRRIAARTSGLPTPAEAACLFGVGLLACSLAQTPLPWSQLDRIERHGQLPLFSHPVGEMFVAGQTRPGEPVLIMTTLGHRTAIAAGVDDVEPYTGMQSIQTGRQLADSVRALRRAGGRKIFIEGGETWASQLTALRDDFHFAPRTEEPVTHMQMWVRSASRPVR